MTSVRRTCKVVAQHLFFNRFLTPVVGPLNHVASRWLQFATNQDNDPACNGEYWLLTRCAGLTNYVDVGFNLGDWSRHVLAVHPEATVHAFDPDPGVVAGDVHRGDPRLHFYPVALGNAEGSASFVSLGACSPSNSLARPHHNDTFEQTGTTTHVEVLTLDAWAKQNAIASIDVLKIDAEGYDFDVIRGAADLFARKKVGICVFEYGYCWLETGRLLVDATKFAASRGYEVFRLFNNFLAPYSWKPAHENCLSGQFVLVRDDMLSRFRVRRVNIGF